MSSSLSNRTTHVVVALALLAAVPVEAQTPPRAAARTAARPVSAAWPAAQVADPTQLGFSAQGLAALDARMQQAVDKGELSGMSYALVKDGQVARLKSIGRQSINGPPVTADTLFRIRSTGKTITGVAMMQLWEQGKWKPEDPITKFLPELANLKVATSADNLDSLAPVSHTPTMSELMTHTAGFGYGLTVNTAVDRAFRAKDVLHARDSNDLVKRVAEIPLAVQPGVRWNYSISVDLQGAIIERITGQKLGDYFEQHIFKPLAMNDTGFWLTEAQRPRLATVNTINTQTGKLEAFKDADNMAADNPFKAHSNFESGGGGASGLISTLHDMVRFTQMLVNRGELGGRRILKPETVDYMMQNHIGDIKVVRGGAEYGFGYGGLVVRDGPTATTPQPKGAFSHFSIEGAWFWVDPANTLAFVGLIQRRGPAGPGGVAMGGEGDAPKLVYQALAR